jgi:type IV secretion system protein VirB3
MSKELGKVQRDPLFLALTRPAMIFGVPMTFALANGMIWMVVYIQTQSFLYLFGGMVVGHLIGYYLAAYEPRFMEIIKIYMKTVPPCINKGYHGQTCSYDLY